MRLSPADVQILVSVVSSHLQRDARAELWLYGSRVHDRLRGGDIDFLLLSADPVTLAHFRNVKLDLLVELKHLLGDQKIDLRIASPAEATADIFLRTVLPSAVCLHRWGDPR